MGKSQTGILGTISGKVGAVVGATWKDKAYFRAYVIPGNPQTAAQTAQRTKMAAVGQFMKFLVGAWAQQYLDKFLRGMSGYNWLVQQNIDSFVVPIDYPAVCLSSGPLWNPMTASVVANAATDEAVVTFDTSNGNNGLATDKIYAVAYNPTVSLFGFAAAEVNRSTGTITVPVSIGVGHDIHVWLLAAQYEGTTLRMISQSVHAEAVGA